MTSHRPKHDSDILAGIARGPWALLWADEQEEKGRSFSQIDIYEAAPKTPAWAKKWAREVADEIVKLNNNTSLRYLYDLVSANGFPYDAENFGSKLGCQVTGHGISWSDDTDLPHDTIKRPYSEFCR